MNYNAAAYFESKLDHYPFLQSSYYSEQKYIVFDKPIEVFLQQAPATTGTIMARKESIIRAGLFDTDLLMQQDIHLFLRLALKCKYGFIGKPLLAKREHKNNTTSDPAITLEWRLKAYRKLISDPEFAKYKEKLRNQIFNISTDLCYLNRKAHSFNRALTCSIQSIRSKPTSTKGWKNMVASILRIS
ncbi:hypothetical protein [Methylocaldum szegediense]|nr:hypothetical protein [Methylocaldum szegediense]